MAFVPGGGDTNDRTRFTAVLEAVPAPRAGQDLRAGIEDPKECPARAEWAEARLQPSPPYCHLLAIATYVQNVVLSRMLIVRP
ncbi:hypothetical protein GCM10027187_25100 [Streptosporangium sandarakinum]